MEHDLPAAGGINVAYHTATYLFVFLPVILCVYQLAPQRTRWCILLLSGYVFIWTFSGKMALWLAGTSLFTHYICLWISYARERQPSACKKILVFGILALLGVLGYVKYYNFFAANWNRIFAGSGVIAALQPRTLLIPLGISFYTLRAIGYMTDVYWKKAEVILHPGKTALFLGFFPQIMEGPISSYAQTADALWAGEPIRAQNLSAGSVRIIWGLFKKLIIADRLSVLVSAVFDHYTEYHGAMVAVAAIAYTIQLYMEFSGCMDIVNGSARLFGIRLPENFRQPFFAEDAADFWRRWHITLGTWFRTYIFFPVSVSGITKKWNRFARRRFGKYMAKTGTLAIALFPVWLCNGLWHGPRWSYVFYGMYYFTILFLETATEPLRNRILKRLHIRKEASWYKVIRIFRTWIVVFVGELFFRAEGLRIGMQMFRSMFEGFSFQQLQDGMWLKMGLDQADYLAISVGTAVVLIVGIIKETRGSGECCLSNLRLPIRWVLYYGLIFSVVVFGAYGIGYEPVDLIYAGF